MNLLHLIHDNKFFGFATEVFGVLPDVRNRYVAHVPDAGAALQHIGGVSLWRRVGNGYFLSRDAREDLAWADCLIVHYAQGLGALLMLRAPARVVVAWSGWGADYLDLMVRDDRELLTAETVRLLEDLGRLPVGGPFTAAIGRAAARGWHRCIDRPLRAAAVSRVDLFSAPLREDYDALREALGPRLRARYAQLHYGSVERTFRPGPDGLTGGDILVGNSATPTNNHVDVLRALAGRRLGNRKVVVPLSYGDARYRDAIVAIGNRLLGDRFEPLLRFLPLPEYNALIARCSTAIMNHRRQQAIGNISAMLYRGARVFLDESSAVYRFLNKHGAHVFGMGTLADAGDAGFDPLPDGQREANRSVLNALWSHDAVMRDTRRFLEAVGQCRAARA